MSHIFCVFIIVLVDDNNPDTVTHKVNKVCLFVCFPGDRHDAAGHSLPVLGPDREALLEAGAQPDRVVLVCSHCTSG